MPLLFAVIMVAGMFLGYRLHDTLRGKRTAQESIQRNDRLEGIIDLINAQYVDSISSNALYADAVKGVLSHLDPHTVYIPADQLGGMNEDLEGKFFGIGIEYAIFRDTLTVTAVVQEGPASKAGVAIGDQFIKVGNAVVAGVGIETDSIVHLLRGSQKSIIPVTVRNTIGQERIVQITRDEVPIYSIDAGIMLDAQTGYIRINRFAANTYSEFTTALKGLKKSGAKNLIIDLRENPGGYLEAATDVADEVIDGDKLLVYTNGIHSGKQEYNAGKSGLMEEGRLAVLVDENSASAAEILAGAIQDWDRGVIIGRRTFGKGLVQEQFDLDDGSALRLTIARYYTPSGRSIQRSFAGGKDAYEQAYEKRYTSGELTGNDSIVKEDTARYYTAHHRLVRGGGGIKPDVYVPYDSTRFTSGIINLLGSEELQQVVWNYYRAHATALRNFNTPDQFAKGFMDAPAILQTFLNNAPSAERTVGKAALARGNNNAWMLAQIRARLARILFSNNGYYLLAAPADDELQRALQIINNPQQYLGLIRGQSR